MLIETGPIQEYKAIKVSRHSATVHRERKVTDLKELLRVCRHHLSLIMCLLSINYHPSCGCTYYTLESDCGSSASSHPSCVQFMTFPSTGLWRTSASHIRRVSGDCGVCSGVGDSGEVLARVNLFRPQNTRQRQLAAGGGRPESGLSIGTTMTGTSTASSYSSTTSSNLKMDGLSKAVSMGIKARNGAKGNTEIPSKKMNSGWSDGVCTIL